jgi:hypothetical protein
MAVVMSIVLIYAVDYPLSEALLRFSRVLAP